MELTKDHHNQYQIVTLLDLDDMKCCSLYAYAKIIVIRIRLIDCPLYVVHFNRKLITFLACLTKENSVDGSIN